jgi:hypothetical protein
LAVVEALVRRGVSAGPQRKPSGFNGAFTNQSFARGLVWFMRQVSGNILATL